QRPPLVRLRSGLEICLRPSGFPVAGNTLTGPRLHPFGPPVFGYTTSTEPKRRRDFNPLVYCAARRTKKRALRKTALRRAFRGEPAGARTQDTRIKRAVVVIPPCFDLYRC